MIKCLVFTTLLVAVSCFPTDFEGLLDHDVFNEKDESPVCKEENARFKSCFGYDAEMNTLAQTVSKGGVTRETSLDESKRIKEGLKCLGEVKCNKMIFVKFGAESTVFGIEKLFNEGYKCTSQIDFQSSLMICAMSEVPMEAFQTEGLSALGAHAGPVARCISKTPKCGDVPRKAFLQGSLAMADFMVEGFKFIVAPKNHDLEALNSFNKKFNPSDYDNVEL